MINILRTICFISLITIFNYSSAALSLKLKDGKNIKLYEKSYALIVGVSDYEYWPDLPGVTSDVKKVSSTLRQHGFEVIEVLNPTRAEFDNVMRDFISKYGQDEKNRLLFYFAGHGHSLKSRYGSQLGYIIPANASEPDKDIGLFKKKAISMLEMEIYAKQMESKHALFLFDSCFSGSLFALTRSIPPVISAKLAAPVRQFITAGAADQKVPDESIFRSQFVEGLNGAADNNNDGYITGTELAQFLENKVTNYSRSAQTPQYGKIRDPFLDKGDFLFFRKDVLEKNTSTVKSTANQGEAVNPVQLELAYWNSVQNTRDPLLIQSYINKYPSGRFIDLAKLKINSLKRKNEESKNKMEEQAVELAKLRKSIQEQIRLREELELLKQNQAKMKKESSLDTNTLKKSAEEQELLLAKLHAEKTKTNVLKSSQLSDSSQRISGPNGKIMIVTHGQVYNYTEYTDEEHALKISARLKEITQQFVGENTNIFELKDHSTGKDLLYDDDNKVSANLCKKYKIDHVVAGLVEQDFQTSPPNPIRDFALFVYDCNKGKKTTFNLPLYRNSKDTFVRSHAISKGYEKFIAEYLENKI